MFGIKSVHEDGMFLTSSNRGCSYCCNSFHEREGQLWIKIFPDKPITKKPLEVRMGKGKVQLSIGLPLLNPEELCLKLEVPLSVAKGVTSCGIKASSKN
jgi:large subunit ribosomal protein L16